MSREEGDVDPESEVVIVFAIFSSLRWNEDGGDGRKVGTKHNKAFDIYIGHQARTTFVEAMLLQAPGYIGGSSRSGWVKA